VRINARMTSNTSLSMGPVGWLIVVPFMLAMYAALGLGWS
jgi:hypothetical protein